MRPRPAKLYDAVKRVLDVVGASVLLIVTSPVQAVVAGAVAYKLGRPVLFRQERPGRDEKIFTILKYRTMLPEDPACGVTTDEQRLTSFGRKLRELSLDELPELWNVLRGDMSLVGPRPLLVKYLARYSADQARRHDVRPGITGLAQAGGRNDLNWDEKLRLDVEYVDRRSLVLDLQIVARTAVAVLRREGITQVGHATMPEFEGPHAN